MSVDTTVEHASILPLHFVEGFFRRKRFITITFCSVLVASAVLTFALPKRYTAEMKFLVDNTRPQLVVSADPDSDAPRQITPVSEADINTDIELLNSSDILRKVALDAGLDRSVQAKKGEAEEHRIERAVEHLQRDLNITDAHKSDVILVKYNAQSPALAEAVLRSLAREFTEFGIGLRQSTEAGKVFGKQAASYREQLIQAQENLAAFHQANGFSDLPHQVDLTVDSLVTAQRDLDGNTASVDEVSGNTAQLRSEIGKEGDTTQSTKHLPNQNEVEHLSVLLTDLENQRSLLSGKFKATDRSIADLDNEITNTQTALDRARTGGFSEVTVNPDPVAQQLKTDLAETNARHMALLARRTALLHSYTGDRDRLKAFEGATLTEAKLQRAVKESQDNYDLYTRKAEDARIAASLDQQKIANVTLAESPTAEAAPTFPNKSLFLLLGFVLACFASVGGALLAEVLSGSLYTPSEIERRTGIPVLATLPARPFIAHSRSAA